MTPETKRAATSFFPDKEVLEGRFEQSPHRKAILGFLEENQVPAEAFLNWGDRRLFLSDIDILRHFLAGNIIIDPFDITRLTPNSYDVALGHYFFRQEQINVSSVTYESPRHRLTGRGDFPEPGLKKAALSIFNPYDSLNVEYVWRRAEPIKAGEFKKLKGVSLAGIDDDEEILMIGPHEMILAHTEEFIGGRNVVTTMVSAKSSTGRSMLEVCNDANLGHIGFINRWTLEIRNKSDIFAVPVVVGRTYAQISFMGTGPSAQSYQGSYQKDVDIEEIEKNWTPEMMMVHWKKTKGLR